jgi:purine-nucleoside phosphorylase
MLYSEKIAEALGYIENKISTQPDVGIILGSGLGKLAEKAEKPVVIPYEDIPYWPRSTAPGHAGKLVLGYIEGRYTAIMQGRVHYYEGYTMKEVTFPTRVLGVMGIKALVATNASGGVNTDIKPGSIVAIKDHINYMGTNPLIGENCDEWGPRFPDMTTAYDNEFRKSLKNAADKEMIDLNEGVYIAFSGPSFETPAEIVIARKLGADLVGMSTVPEVIVANHMGIRVCGISCVANYAAGITENKLTHQEVLDTMDKAGDSICRLIAGFLREMKI